MDAVEDGRYSRVRVKHAKLLAADIFGQMAATDKNKGPSAAELVSVEDREEDTIFLAVVIQRKHKYVLHYNIVYCLSSSSFLPHHAHVRLSLHALISDLLLTKLLVCVAVIA